MPPYLEIEKIQNIEDYFTTIVPPEKGRQYQDLWRALDIEGVVDKSNLEQIPDKEARFKTIEALLSLLENETLTTAELATFIKSFSFCDQDFSQLSAKKYRGQRGVAGYDDGHIFVFQQLFERYQEGENRGEFVHELDHNIAHEVAHSIIELVDGTYHNEQMLEESQEEDQGNPLKSIEDILDEVDIESESRTVLATIDDPELNRKERLAEVIAVFMASKGNKSDFLFRRARIITKAHFSKFFSVSRGILDKEKIEIQATSKDGQTLLVKNSELFGTIESLWETIKTTAAKATETGVETGEIFDVWNPLMPQTQVAELPPISIRAGIQPDTSSLGKSESVSKEVPKSRQVKDGLPGKKPGHSQGFLSALFGIVKSFEEISPIKTAQAEI